MSDNKLTLNELFQEVYGDSLKDIMSEKPSLLSYILGIPPDFYEKYSREAWQKLGIEDQEFIQSQGLLAWEKKNEYNDSFEKLIK